MRQKVLRGWLPAAMVLVAAGCTGGSSRTLLQNKGSDTLVNVAQSWAEAYRAVRPEVGIAVSGGGSGTGIAALINGTVDIANASRDIKPDEREAIRAANGKDPVEHVVARDAIVVYVHKDNPLAKVTIEQLACIYGHDGTCETWTDLGVEVPGCADQDIIRVSRQSNSGTYEFFREAVLGKQGDFKLGSRDMQGSKDVVDLVAHTPCAIGYSGIGYMTDGVGVVCLATDGEHDCVKPSIDTAKAGTYPLSRALYMYTLGQAEGPVADYLAWILSPAGQEIVARTGFVPVN
jgi:phosphate transport system substrate-binding protein